jgi:hypothetical protein
MEDDVLTVEEEQKIERLMREAERNYVMPKMAMSAAMASLSREPADFSFSRRLGLDPVVTVHNISGVKAWVILAPAPILGVSSVGVERLGQISFSTTGDYKCQQASISDNSRIEFELDNSQIYYSVFFQVGDKWKTPFKNRRINTRKYNINLLERHVADSIDLEVVPA